MTSTKVIVLSDAAARFMATPAPIFPMVEDIYSIRSASTAWYVVYTDAQSEDKVARRIQEVKAEVFLPHTVEWKKKTRAARDQNKPPVAVSRPLLSRYLFVRLPMAGEAVARIQEIDGVLSILGHGERKTPVPTRLVEFLKEREEAGDFNKTIKRGRVVVPTWVREGLRVQIKEGPFAQFWGVVEKCLPRNCLRVAVDIFGRATPVELELAQVREPAA